MRFEKVETETHATYVVKESCQEDQFLPQYVVGKWVSEIISSGGNRCRLRGVGR